MKGWAACVVAVLAGSAIAGAQQATFSTRLEAVRVDVLVSDRGRPVPGLGRADFELLDNGVPQTVDLVSFEQVPINAVLAFDLSKSVSGERLDHLRDAARALIAGLQPQDSAALLTFSHRVTLAQPLTNDAAALAAAVKDVEPIGDTSLYDGTYAAMTLGLSDPGRDLVIVFSDGVDTASWLSSDQVLDAARRADAVVYGVSVRGVGSAPFLRDLGSQTGGGMLEVESSRDLSSRFVAILAEFRQRYLVSYSPTGVAKGGFHRLDVRVKNRRMTVKARPGYLAR